MSRLGYLPALDGLRTVAVSGVLVAHVGVPHLQGGVIGVYIFFVLSGFLITTLLLVERHEQGRIDLPRFYGRRALRLAPALVAVIVATTTYMLVVDNDPIVRRGTLGSVLPALGYYANWEWFAHGTGPGVLGFFGHMWSLSVEEQFYVLWPLVLVVLRPSPRRAAAGLGLVIALSLLIRLLTFQGVEDAQRLFGTHAVADQLAIGCLLAVAQRTAPDQVARACRLLLLPALAGLAGGALWFALTATGVQGRVSGTVGLTIIATAAAAVIGYITNCPEGLLSRVLAVGPLVYLGRRSYGIYLWHILVSYSIRDHTSIAGPLRWVLSVTVTAAVASISFHLLEQPLQRRIKPLLHPAG